MIQLSADALKPSRFNWIMENHEANEKEIIRLLKVPSQVLLCIYLYSLNIQPQVKLNKKEWDHAQDKTTFSIYPII